LRSAPIWVVLLLLLVVGASTAQTAAPTDAPDTDSVCLNEILVSTPQPYDSAQLADAQHKAEGARAAIQQGARFEDVAKKYSDGLSAAYGGPTGAIKRGHLAKEIEEKVFAMKAGDISDVMCTKQGFVILQVTECNPVAGKHGGPGTVEVHGDTQGLEIGAYLQRVTRDIQANFYRQIVPESDIGKNGKIGIELFIMKDGSVANMRLVASSGDATLDRAAWAVVARSQPFPPLPSDFTAPHFVLQLLVTYK
jgi:TonB family protein